MLKFNFKISNPIRKLFGFYHLKTINFLLDIILLDHLVGTNKLFLFNKLLQSAFDCRFISFRYEK